MPGIGYGSSRDPSPEDLRKWDKQAQQHNRGCFAKGCLLPMAALVALLWLVAELGKQNKEAASSLIWGVIIISGVAYIAKEIWRSLTED